VIRESIPLGDAGKRPKAAGDPLCSDVDSDLDREISYAARITIRVMHELMKKHESPFPGKREPVFDGVYDEDLAE